jgi:hypothetical protein
MQHVARPTSLKNDNVNTKLFMYPVICTAKSFAVPSSQGIQVSYIFSHEQNAGRTSITDSLWKSILAGARESLIKHQSSVERITASSTIIAYHIQDRST